LAHTYPGNVSFVHFRNGLHVSGITEFQHAIVCHAFASFGVDAQNPGCER
jgi:hypothetical protein